jgi:hypothetical protein
MEYQREKNQRLTATNEAGKYTNVRSVIHFIKAVSLEAFSVNCLILVLSSCAR